jgi:energy-coupling factor transporter ATP-binding protein EcfA2
VLILDEPTRGIDVGAKVEVHQLIDELAAEGMAIIVISSDLPEALAMSDRILVMREGRQVTILPHAEATQERVLAAAMGQEGIEEAIAALPPAIDVAAGAAAVAVIDALVAGEVEVVGGLGDEGADRASDHEPPLAGDPPADGDPPLGDGTPGTGSGR